MLLRTISVETADQTELNAALLCGFAIPDSERNFIAYSLNEQLDEVNSRVYIASLYKTEGGFRPGRIDDGPACEAAIQVFRQIVREAATGNRRANDLAYHLLDLQEAEIAPARRDDHRSLALNHDWVMQLVTFQPPAGYGPALDGEEPCEEVPPLVCEEAHTEDPAAAVIETGDGSEPEPEPADVASPAAGERSDEPEATEERSVAGTGHDHLESETDTAEAPAEACPDTEHEHAGLPQADAIGTFVDNASHLREELAGLAQMLSPEPLPDAEPPHATPDTPEEPSMTPSPSPLASPERSPEPTSARVPNLSLRLQVPSARPLGVGSEAIADSPQPPVSSRQPEDEPHVDTDTTLNIGTDTDHLLQDVQGTLADLAGMAQQLSQQKQEALKQQESLESRKAQLHERERLLQEKEKQLKQWHKRLQDDRQALEQETEQSSRLLAERSAALQQLAESVEARERSSARRAEVLQVEQERIEEQRNQQNLRQAELEKREAGVQQRSLELAERYKKLESAREKLAQIVKGFNETVQFNTTLHAISNTALNTPQARQEESTAELE
ncbi:MULTISPECIES: hypothetical protein [Pseudomonas aeruginosa group]|uniref:hypothetical protein n=1 Tax=Pseudomonas aeruginosa group TaxID=136841 RepID=UPI00071BEB78|nr:MULTISPECIES: hypothetical protein [Pseudomonas aeruginosa group]KSP83177.1 hypothetical protein APB27_29790 [Pseudomonas aeruginosa]MCW8021574.1 hypothetical protein [Pseudomonas aeruginosa]MDK2352032.1 hypothetical protein [Pseudomonas paraeruginosa]MEA8483833.1 hypothetical protein [Pseudomonas aeruginosa]RTT29136.1 hypothetical protein DY956_28495 [Pseudomonas paraeruginosa]